MNQLKVAAAGLLLLMGSSTLFAKPHHIVRATVSVQGVHVAKSGHTTHCLNKGDKGPCLVKNAGEKPLRLDLKKVTFKDHQGLGEIRIRLTHASAQKFKGLTHRKIGKRLGMFVGNQFISAPRVEDTIDSGTLAMTFRTHCDYEQAKAALSGTPQKTLAAHCK